MARPTTLAFGLVPTLALSLLGCVGAFMDKPRGPVDDGPAGDADAGPPLLPDSVQDPVTGRVTPSNPLFVPISPLVRRLTRDEYLNTVGDVLGVTLAAGDQALLPVDRPLDGFVNTASGQGTVPDHVLAYHVLAERVLAGLDLGAFLTEHADCRESTPTCAAGFVASTVELLFRRPGTADEHDAYRALFDALTSDGADFEEAAGGVLEALLQAPQFLYLLEAERDDSFDGLRAVGGHEMASRLSYYLWKSAPDAALREAAASGALDDRDNVAREVTRMLEDSKSKRSSARFLLDWARLESLPDEDGLTADLTATAIAFYQDFLLQKRGSLPGLFTAPTAFLTPALAVAYGVPSLGDRVREYDLKGVTGRLGLLAQPGVIAGMTNADGGEIVARGLFQMVQLFCGDAPDPPASLQDKIDGFLATLPPEASQRQVAEARLKRPECGACHAGFDPVGYALEHFTARGAYRDRDAFGNALSDDGFIPARLNGTDADVAFDDFEGFTQAVSRSERVMSCLIQKNTQFALGQHVGADQAASIEELAKALGDRPFEDIVQAIVRHDLFRTLPIE